jgi:hypothetical protein
MVIGALEGRTREGPHAVGRTLTARPPGWHLARRVRGHPGRIGRPALPDDPTVPKWKGTFGYLIRAQSSRAASRPRLLGMCDGRRACSRGRSWIFWPAASPLPGSPLTVGFKRPR